MKIFLITQFNDLIFFLLLIIPFSLSLSFDVSKIIPLKRIILTTNISKLHEFTNVRLDINPKGYGLTFNNNSNISLIPYTLFEEIKGFYRSFEEVIVTVKKHENGTEELMVDAFLGNGFETPHFIFEDGGISIPLKYYFTEIKNSGRYIMRFLTTKDQDYITFGKDLIQLMDIEFKDDHTFIIKNEEFISKKDE